MRGGSIRSVTTEVPSTPSRACVCPTWVWPDLGGPCLVTGKPRRSVQGEGEGDGVRGTLLVFRDQRRRVTLLTVDFPSV